MDIFKAILDSRSSILIERLAEDALPTATGEDKAALEKILNTNDLDERYAISHDRLGHTDKAAELREWINGKAARRAKSLSF